MNATCFGGGERTESEKEEEEDESQKTRHRTHITSRMNVGAKVQEVVCNVGQAGVNGCLEGSHAKRLT